MKDILDSLDRLNNDPTENISNDHLSYLLAFELIKISEEGEISLTEEGKKLKSKFEGESDEM